MADQRRYQCCFYGKTIEPIPPDPGELWYTTSYGEDHRLRKDQTNWCHTECLRARLHPSVKLYAVDCMNVALKDQQET